MDLSKRQTLKQLLLEAEKFQGTRDHFMIRFGGDQQFMDLGERTRSPRLEARIERAAEERTAEERTAKKLQMGKRGRMDRRLLIANLEESFIQGSVLLNGHMDHAFCFEDPGVGLLTVARATMRGRTPGLLLPTRSRESWRGISVPSLSSGR